MINTYTIFDNVITMRTATDEGIWVLVQEKLNSDKVYNKLSQKLKKEFSAIRANAEIYAHKHRMMDSDGRFTIYTIYRAIKLTGAIDEKDIDSVIELEERTVIENVLPIWSNIETIKQQIADNQRVILVEDTYYSERLISKMLCSFLDIGSVDIFLSSETGFRLSDGTLYSYISEKEKILSEQIISHPRTNNGTYLEKIEINILHRFMFDKATQLLIGAMKYTRLTNVFGEPGSVGASLSAIFLCAYVMWILNDAYERGFNALGFIARDGYIAKEIADIFVKCFDIPIQIEYVYGSRSAWRSPSFKGENDDIRNAYFNSIPERIDSIAKLSSIYGLTEEEIGKFLSVSTNAEYSRLDMEVFVEFLSENEEFQELLRQKNLEKVNNISLYFRNLFPDEKQVAFVDMGGTGYTQECLSNILRDIGINVYTYYFHIYGTPKCNKDRVFVFRPFEEVCVDAIEPLCRAMHGQTIGYTVEENEVQPIIDAGEEQRMIECGYEEYISAILSCATTIGRYYTDLLKENVNGRMLDQYWDYYINACDSKIVDFVCEIPFDTDGTGREIVYAPKLDQETINDICINGIDKEAWYYNGEWAFQFSLQRMSEKDRNYILENKKYKTKEKRAIKTVFARIQEKIIRDKKNIVLYCSGLLGKEFVKQIDCDPDRNLVLWVDKNYLYHRSKGLDISSPKSLFEMDDDLYDIIIIALINKGRAETLKKYLVDQGINADKIVWLAPDELIRG